MTTTVWVYRKSEPGLWTVGYYDPKSGWNTDSDHSDREEAAKRVHWLNGGNDQDIAERQEQREDLAESVRIWSGT